MLKKTLGSLIKAEPKKHDYDIVANILVKNIYESLKNGNFGLFREARFNHNDPNTFVSTSNFLIKLNTEENKDWGTDYIKSAKYFVDSNMNEDILSKAVMHKLVAFDKENEKLFNDVKLVLGYYPLIAGEEHNEENFKLYSKVDALPTNPELSINLAFTTELSGKDLLKAYEEDDSPRAHQIFGEVESFVVL